jgi:SAM-dependent methyltransferase
MRKYAPAAVLRLGERLASDQCRHVRRRLFRPAWLGTLRRTTPLSDRYGYDRGTPVDRYYIECFLQKHHRDIQGRVLEVKDSYYTNRYGTDVTHRDVLDIDPSNSQATIIADLAVASVIPSEQFDCFILTQTLHFIFDTSAAIAHAHRILGPGGVLLATIPAISRVDPQLAATDYWRFTVASCSALFGEVFGRDKVSVESHGNILTAIAFLTGMAHEELSREELGTNDRYFPLIITVRGIKS